MNVIVKFVRSFEFEGWHAAMIFDVRQFQLLVFFALRVEIDTTDCTSDLVEAYVIETLKARARDGAHAMIRHEKVLLPAHEDVLALREILDAKVLPRLCLLCQGPPGWKSCPMLHVHFIR